VYRRFLFPNTGADEEAYHRYEIAPEDFLRAETTAASLELDVIGIYHSHPDHPAKPSDFDLDHALPFYLYAIVSVEHGTAKDLTAWRLKSDRSEFEAEDLDEK